MADFVDCKLILTMSVRCMLLFQMSSFCKYKYLFQTSICQIVSLIEYTSHVIYQDRNNMMMLSLGL